MKRKYSSFVLFAIAACILYPSVASAELPCKDYSSPDVSVTLSSQLEEISGLAVSHSNPDYLWALTDSCSEPELYLINRSGEVMRTYRLRNTPNIDWEDLAVGPCEPWGEQSCIYIGDTGNNSFNRKNLRVLSVVEPDVSDVTSPSETNIKVDILHTWQVKYPESSESADLANPDSESIMVKPGSGDVYIVSKHSEGGIQRLYQMTRGGEHAGELTLLASYNKFNCDSCALFLVLQALFNATTGADFSPDGQRFLVRTYGLIYEYDLTAYNNDIAEAFAHPAQRFETRELQGESVTYDTDGKSIITAGEETGMGAASMNFFLCEPNEAYSEPAPMVVPDPIPAFEPEPDPIYGCIASSYHEYDESCEYDSWFHCGTHDVNCKSQIANWHDGSCWSKTCHVSECENGYVPSSDGKSCVCSNNAHLYSGSCEADSVDNCGTHGTSCASEIQNWQNGECREKHCAVTECANGFVPSEDSSACICSPQTHHRVGDGCEADSVDNCGTHGTSCAGEIQNWQSGECQEKHCVVTACANGFEPSQSSDACICPDNAHLFGESCESDAVEHCGAHDVQCNSSIAHWQSGECRDKHCVVNACADNLVPSDAHDACVEPGSSSGNPGNSSESDSKGKSGGDSCSATVMPNPEITGIGALWMLGLAGLWIARRRRRQQ